MTEVITEVALFFSLRGDGVGGIMIARSAIQANGTIGLLPLEWQRIPASHDLKSKCPVGTSFSAFVVQ